MMKKIISRYLNERGLSLIQVLLASSAIAGLAVVGLKLAEDQKALALKTGENYLTEYLVQEVKSLLSHRETCTLTLKGLKPNGGVIESIHRFSNDKDDIRHSHFPISEEGSDKGKYFESRVELLSYKLGQEKMRGELVKGMSTLKVEFKIRRDNRKIVKEIPIIYQLDGEERIAHCHSGVIDKSTTTDGFWKIREESISLDNLKLRVGADIRSSGQLQVDGALFLTRQDLVPCRDEDEGILKNIKGSLKYCSQRMWKPFGLSKIRWKNIKIYKVKQNQKGQGRRETDSHRFCYLYGQERRHLSDGCKINRTGKLYKSSYIITAYTSALATKNICEVACVE